MFGIVAWNLGLPLEAEEVRLLIMGIIMILVTVYQFFGAGSLIFICSWALGSSNKNILDPVCFILDDYEIVAMHGSPAWVIFRPCDLLETAS